MVSATVPESVNSGKKSELLSGLASKNLGPLWTVMNALVTRVPSPQARPTIWRYDQVRPDLIKAGEMVPEEEAERRVLMLINSSMRAPYTTDTLYAGLQLVNPGETAPAHRHVAFALRFIIEGTRGFTAVDGQKMYMEKGDMILTPSWAWHDHGNEGDSPMIWLDGLDLPLFQALPVNFADEYHEKRFPSEYVLPVRNSMLLTEGSASLAFPWAMVQNALDVEAAPHAIYRYRKKDGEEVSNTIAAQAERIRAGTTTEPSRRTCSFVYHCAKGHGFTEILSANGTLTTLDWKENDTFAVQAWSRIAHTASGSEDAYLFAFCDRPLLQSLGMYREE